MLPMVIVINMRVIYIIHVSEFCRLYGYRCKKQRALKVPNITPCCGQDLLYVISLHNLESSTATYDNTEQYTFNTVLILQFREPTVETMKSYLYTQQIVTGDPEGALGLGTANLTEKLSWEL